MVNAGQWNTFEKNLKGTGIRFTFNGNLSHKIIDLAPKQRKFDALKAEYLKDVEAIRGVVDNYLDQFNKAKPLTAPAKKLIDDAEKALTELQGALSKIRDTI
jgi:hypothetical protein